jgi:hypothetical protein
LKEVKARLYGKDEYGGEKDDGAIVKTNAEG